MVKYQHCNSTHRHDVGKIATLFKIRLKPNAKLQTQRPTKVPIYYRDKLKILLDELEDHNIIRQIGSTRSEKLKNQFMVRPFKSSQRYPQRKYNKSRSRCWTFKL